MPIKTLIEDHLNSNYPEIDEKARKYVLRSVEFYLMYTLDEVIKDAVTGVTYAEE